MVQSLAPGGKYEWYCRVRHIGWETKLGVHEPLKGRERKRVCKEDWEMVIKEERREPRINDAEEANHSWKQPEERDLHQPISMSLKKTSRREEPLSLVVEKIS